MFFHVHYLSVFCILVSGTVSAAYTPIDIRLPEGGKAAVMTVASEPVYFGEYSIKITEIPYHPGSELFPTVQMLTRSNIPVCIELTLEDFELALEGQLVTKIIYLEDPKKALPILPAEGRQISVDVQSDPLAAAATQGLPAAKIQIGNRLIDSRQRPPVLINSYESVPPPLTGKLASFTNTASAQFHTPDGRTLTETSNPITLNAPRFCSVRRIEGLTAQSNVVGLVAAAAGQKALLDRNNEVLAKSQYDLKTNYTRSRDQLIYTGGKMKGSGVENSAGLVGYNNFNTTDVSVLRLRTFDFRNQERLMLTAAANKAKVWQGVEGIKIQVNELTPMENTGIEGAAVFFQLEDKRSQTHKLRLIKTASDDNVKSGDTVNFTLRFDNVGNMPLDRIKIRDNLTNRLEFVAGSAKSSLECDMDREINAEGSFTLLFLMKETLPPGGFALIEFQCRVR